MEVIKTKRVKANKGHKCDFCSSNIFKGEEYQFDTVVADNVIYNWKSCDHCKDIIRDMYTDFDYPNGVTNSDFCEYIKHYDIEFDKR